MQIKNYYSIIDAISDLQSRGFFLDFILIGNKLLCAQEKCYLEPEDFDILEIYHFDGHGATQDDTVIYAIESLARPLRGILLNAHAQPKMNLPSILAQKIRKFWV